MVAGLKFREGDLLLLLKCIYGLKQSGRYWNQKLVSILKGMGYTPSRFDPCLFMRFDKQKLIALLLFHVDDGLWVAETLKILQEDLSKMSENLPMQDLGQPRKFLGLIIEKIDRHNLKIHQKPYITQMLQNFGMEGARTYPTPAITERLKKDGISAGGVPYRNAIGALLWPAVMTRPDIFYSVIQVAKYCERPTIDHWEAAMKVMRYLKGTSGTRLWFSRKASSEGMVEVYADADCAGEDRRSMSGPWCPIMIALLPGNVQRSRVSASPATIANLWDCPGPARRSIG